MCYSPVVVTVATRGLNWDALEAAGPMCVLSGDDKDLTTRDPRMHAKRLSSTRLRSTFHDSFGSGFRFECFLEHGLEMSARPLWQGPGVTSFPLTETHSVSWKS